MKGDDRFWYFICAVALVAFTNCPWWTAMILFYVLLGNRQMRLALAVVLKSIERQESEREAALDWATADVAHLSIVDDDLEAS